MSKLKVLHTADLHLGATFRDLPESFGGKGLDRVRDYLEKLSLIRRALFEEGYDFLVVAGDLFHHIRPDSLVFDEFAKFVGSLAREGVEIVAVAGNHDQPRTRDAEAYVKALEDAGAPRFHFFKKPGTVTLLGRRSGRKVRFVCLPYLPPQTLGPASYLNLMKETVEKLRIDVEGSFNYTMVVGHLYVEGARIGSEGRLIPLRDPPLSRSLFEWADVACLGHMHSHQILSNKIVYAGSIERVDFDEAGEEKGFVMVSEGDYGLKFNFKPLPSRPLVTIPESSYLDLSKERDHVDALEKFIRNLDGVRGAIVRLRLKLNPDQSIPRVALDREMDAKGVFHYVCDIERVELKKPSITMTTTASLGDFLKEYVRRVLGRSMAKEDLNLLEEEGLRILRMVEEN